MIRLLIGLVIGFVLGSVISAGAATWSSLSRIEKLWYVTGIADGIIFVNNYRITEGREFNVARAAQIISRCDPMDVVVDRLDKLFVSPVSNSETINFVVGVLLQCGGAIP